MSGLTYKDSGVDIDAGNKSVALIKDFVRATYRPEVLGDLKRTIDYFKENFQ